MTSIHYKRKFIWSLLASLLLAMPILAQTTAFTYQGKLSDNGNPATGSYDLQFKLFDTATVGTGAQQGSTVTVSNVIITGGIFTVALDFGTRAVETTGAARFLEIAVKPTSGGTFTTLSPRQPITSTPYAIKSLNAATATSADGLSVACVSCVTSSQIQSVNGSAVTGTIPIASVPDLSALYIQNTTNPQAASNFNISGDGTAAGTLTGGIVNAVQQVNINGLRAFTVNGAFNDGFGTVFTATNTFSGEGAGVNTTPDPILASRNGKFNSFYGAGQDEPTPLGVPMPSSALKRALRTPLATATPSSVEGLAPLIPLEPVIPLSALSRISTAQIQPATTRCSAITQPSLPASVTARPSARAPSLLPVIGYKLVALWLTQWRLMHSLLPAVQPRCVSMAAACLPVVLLPAVATKRVSNLCV